MWNFDQVYYDQPPVEHCIWQDRWKAQHAHFNKRSTERRLKKNNKSAEILTSTVISITHCGTVSLSSMDSVSPPESLHSNLQRKNKADQKKRWTCATISNDTWWHHKGKIWLSNMTLTDDLKVSLPKKGSASRFSKDNWCVWWHLEISVAFLDPVFLLSVHWGNKNIINKPDDILAWNALTGTVCSQFMFEAKWIKRRGKQDKGKNMPWWRSPRCRHLAVCAFTG